MDVEGGPFAGKRLEGEVRGLRESRKLPWVEVAGRRACALVADALALHERLGPVPPPEFARWRKNFLATLSNAGAQTWPPHSPSSGQPSTAGGQPSDSDLLEGSATLLHLPEL